MPEDSHEAFIINRPLTVVDKIRKSPESEEMRKVHSEILQLNNQQFLLTTTSIIFVGTALSWATTTIVSNHKNNVQVNSENLEKTTSMENSASNIEIPPIEYILPAAALLICSVLLVAFFYYSSLVITVRWLAAYLMLQGSSWEWNWYSFRFKRDNACRKANIRMEEPPFLLYRFISGIYISLIIFVFLYFLFLHWIVSNYSLINLSLLLSIENFSIERMLDWTSTPRHYWKPLLIALLVALISIIIRSAKVTARKEDVYYPIWKDAEGHWRKNDALCVVVSRFRSMHDFEAAQRSVSALESTLKQTSGFRGYYVFSDGQGGGGSISLFQTREAAEKAIALFERDSTDKEVTIGEVLGSVTA
jgi:hypothetical protein